jgi:integrase
MGARSLYQLKAKQVEAEKRPGRYADGGGLYLQVQESASGKGVTKSWLFRYTLAGKAREMGLGPAHTVPLATYSVRRDGAPHEVRGARDLAADARRLLLAGIDPLEDRRARVAGVRLEGARAKTFRDCAEAYIRANRGGWRNEKHAAQWVNTLATYCYPEFGDQPVAKIDTALVLKALEPIWTTKAETASRLRGRIESILDWAKVRGYRDGDNPAKWRGHLDHTLPKISRAKRIEHHAALSFGEAPAFLKDLRALEGVAPRLLEFIILTAARTGEALGARWSEFDLQGRVWIVPAERMKGGREHRVPLTSAGVALLKGMRKMHDGDVVFPSVRTAGELSNMACLAVLKRMDRADLTVHGFRSTFRDWASERTSFSREVIEMALAHAIEDKVEAAYRRGDLFDKRRKLMDAWDAFLTRPAGKIVQLGAKRVSAGVA